MSLQQKNLEKLVTEIEETGLAYVEFRGIARRYEELRKVKLNQLKRKYSEDGKRKVSEAKLESLAYADPEYSEFVEQWIRCEKEAEKAKVLYDAKKNLFDSMRSALAYEREKIAKGIYHTGRG